MKIPVFVSAPTAMNQEQRRIHDAIIETLDDLGLEERRLGQSDYPDEAPLKEVIQIARRCAGGVVLGFTQFIATTGIAKPGIDDTPRTNVAFPTPWNQLEAGILFSLKLPVLVFKEKDISGGVFDNGVTDVFVNPMPTLANLEKKGSARQVFLKWQARVRQRYYDWEG
jgi:hypothetical protein